MRRAGKADENFEDDCRNGQYRCQTGYDGRQKHVTRIFLHCARQRFLGFSHLEPGIHSALNLSRTRCLLRFELGLGAYFGFGATFQFPGRSVDDAILLIPSTNKAAQTQVTNANAFPGRLRFDSGRHSEMNPLLRAGLGPHRFPATIYELRRSSSRRSQTTRSGGRQRETRAFENCESIATSSQCAKPPKSATPRSGSLRRACDALRGRNSRAAGIRATVGFAQDQLLSLAWRGGQRFGISSIEPSSRPYANCLCNGRGNSKRRRLGTGRPIKTPAGSTASGFPKLAVLGVSGPFCRGTLWPACGRLTSPSSRAPRTQSFAHQLLDHFAAGRLRLRLRRNKRIHPSQQFWRHPHAHRRPGSCLISSRFSSRAHNPSVWLVQGHIEDLEVDEKPYLTRFRR